MGEPIEDGGPECCPRCGQPWERPDPFALAYGMDRAISAERARVIEMCAKVVENTITGTSNIDVIEQRGADKAAAALRALGAQQDARKSKGEQHG